MDDRLLRVAVISPNPLIRAGLVNLIAQLDERAMVTQALAVDDRLSDHDVAIYDVGGVPGPGTYSDLSRLIDSDTHVIGLVYDRMRDTLPPDLDATSHVITLSVTAEQLREVLAQVVPLGDEADPAGTRAMPDDLTGREIEILRLIATKESNRDIAARLYLSPNTVKTYIRGAYRKIGVTNRAGAVLWALQHGLGGGNDADQRPASSRGNAAPWL